MSSLSENGLSLPVKLYKTLRPTLTDSKLNTPEMISASVGVLAQRVFQIAQEKNYNVQPVSINTGPDSCVRISIHAESQEIAEQVFDLLKSALQEPWSMHAEVIEGEEDGVVFPDGTTSAFFQYVSEEASHAIQLANLKSNLRDTTYAKDL